MVDSYNVDECLINNHVPGEVSLVVTLWLSGVVLDRTFTSGDVDVRGCLFVDNCLVNVFIRVLNFHGLSHL